jgi:ferric-dicitrate binding protein FerR (iron transport regulator)
VNCRDFAERVDEWLDGLAPAADADALRAHAASCTSCTADTERARRFRDLLAGVGRETVASAADREAAARALAAAAASRGTWHRLRAPLAAAAVLVAGLGLGFVAADWRSAPRDAISADDGTVALARGERRTLAEGRTVVADEATRLAVEAGSNGERVRLDEGAAVFQVEHGRPFSVITDLGEAEVRGTLFHVERRADGSVSVGVMSGVVVFHPRTNGAKRTLRAGATLDVARDGTQRITSRSDTADLVMRLEMQSMELDALRGDVAKRDETIADLQARLAGLEATAEGTKPQPSGVQWDRLGAAAHRLLTTPPNSRDPANREAFTEFMTHLPALQELTGSDDVFELPWHPAVVSRTARGFLDALAPGAPEAARARAAESIHNAADAAAAAMTDVVPAEAATARLRMIRQMVTSVRDELGVAAAAQIARSALVSRDGVEIRATADDAASRQQMIDGWVQRFGLPEERRAEASSLIEPWIVATREAQATITREWGDPEASAFLFPERREPGRERGERRPEPRPVVDDATAVANALRRIDATIALLGPKIAVERGLRALLPADASARMGRRMRETYVWTWR